MQTSATSSLDQNATFSPGCFAAANILHLDSVKELDAKGYPKADKTRLYRVEGKCRPVLVVHPIGKPVPRDYLVLQCTSKDRSDKPHYYVDLGYPLDPETRTWVNIRKLDRIPKTLVTAWHDGATDAASPHPLSQKVLDHLVERVTENDAGAVFLRRYLVFAAVKPAFTAPPAASFENAAAPTATASATPLVTRSDKPMVAL